jgi:hypothetical protein
MLCAYRLPPEMSLFTPPSTIEEAPDGSERVNRINYEICVLQSLRERLRSKEVWVAGAERYRNPDEDLPTDFAQRRVACYGGLGSQSMRLRSLPNC